MVKQMNVESFNLDHTKVKAPYVRLASSVKGENGDVVYKYDIRFKQPNKGHMEMPAIHSLEHLMAEFIRNHHNSVIDLSQMGSQTGFYLSVFNDDNYDGILDAIEKTLKDVLKVTDVPATNEIQCGWAESHDLESAQTLAREMLDKRSEWKEVFGKES